MALLMSTCKEVETMGTNFTHDILTQIAQDAGWDSYTLLKLITAYLEAHHSNVVDQLVDHLSTLRDEA